MTFGPVQVLVLGFEGINFQGKILAELTRLREADIVRLVDLVVVAKDEDGDLATLKTSDLSDEESAEFGAIAGALIGLGAEGADGAEAVSYTHLRAHETDSYLVCRLLLE